MKLFIGHISALEYWSTHDRDPFQAASEAFPKPGIAPTWEDVLNASPAQYGISDEPLHINVATIAERRPSKNLVCHATESTLPKGSYLRIAPLIYVNTPESALLQSATSLTPIQLTQVIYELCGTYGISPNNQELIELNPRTSVKKIKQFAKRFQNYRGAKRLLTALRYAADDSASPMETKLTMLLCLPTLHGGYGLPLPILNREININADEKRYCDLCWPKSNFALEYDSDLYHSSTEQLHRDSNRRTTIELDRLHLVSVSSDQVHDRWKFDKVARVTALNLEKRLRITRKDVYGRRTKLRKELFSSKSKQAGKINA